MKLPIEFTPKFFSVLQEGITKEQLQKDILAGIIVGIVALPLAIAFAIASGVSPEKGLITAIFAGFIISILGVAVCKLVARQAHLSLLFLVLLKNMALKA